MWHLLKTLLFGGAPEPPPKSDQPVRLHVADLAPAPQPMPDSASGQDPLAARKRPSGSGVRPHTQSGGGFATDLNANLQALRKVLGASTDATYRTFLLAGEQRRAALVYLDGMVETESVNDYVLRPLMHLGTTAATAPPAAPMPAEEGGPVHPLLRRLQQSVVVNKAVSERTVFTLAVDDLLGGAVLLLVDGVEAVLSIPQQGYKERSVQEPLTESVIRGPRDGFVESLRVNLTLVRRRLRDPNLRLEVMKVGRRTNTEVALCYIQDVARKQLVDEIRTRIQGIDIDGVLESGYIEQMIEDNHYSPFPQVQNTERVDRAVANLLEGRVVILVDGSPFCLILPSVFSQFYQTPEDYYERFLIATLVRGIRVISLFFSLTFTALYVALISFHSEMLPTRFAVAVAGGRAGVPFPSVAEAFFMELTMEILREAGIRLPRNIGQTVSIVGALVIGEAAVKAGVVSPLMVIVVALTSIGSFAVPSYSAAIALRIVKFPIILAAGIFGLYGVMLAIIGLVVHLAALSSVGVPYLAPFAPAHPEDVKDTLVRLPLWSMIRRPKLLGTQDATRMPHSTDFLGNENLGVEGDEAGAKPQS